MKKRILASLMALCLIVGLLPTAALAVDPGTEQTAQADPGTEQESAGDPAGPEQEQAAPVLEDAVTQPEGDGNGAADAEEPREETPPISEAAPAAAADGYTDWASENSLPTSGTYRLTQDVTVQKEVTVGRWASSRPEKPTTILTLDLNGHTITAASGQAFFVQVSGGLVIEDSKGDGKITNAEASGSSKTLIQINDGSFELKGGTLENTSSMGYALHLNVSSTGAISGGTVVNTGSGGHAVFVNSSAQLTMTGGEIKNTENGGHAVYINGTAAFTMEGGKVTQESTYSSSAAIYANNSATSISISGGEVVSKSMGVSAAFTPVTVTGGTFQTDSYAFQTRYATIDPAEDKTVSVNSKGAVFYTFSESNNKIVDGEFEAPALTKSYTMEKASTLTVSGGTFDIEKVVDSAGDNSNIAISGGTFEKAVPDLEEHLDSSKEIQVQPDGSLIVQNSSGEKLVTVTINGGEAKTFDTLAKAIEKVNQESAGASITVTLGRDQIAADNIQIKKGLNVTLDLGGHTLRGPDSGYTFQFGSFDKGTASKAEDCDYINGGTLTLKNGTVIGYQGVRNYFGNVVLDQGLTMTTKERLVNTYGGKITVQGAKLKSTTAFGVGLFNSFYPFDVNAAATVTNSAHEKNKSAEFVMTAGSIDTVYYPITGNALRSAGTKATITGGSLTATEAYTAIYWPMEGTLTIGGDAVITGGTGIEAKMGTITIQDNAKVTGTATYKDGDPTNGGSSPEGSALLLSAQMYGTSGQYKENNQLQVNITGGALTSKQGNAVTVYNTEKIDDQTATVTVSGGAFEAKKAAIISVTTDGNTVTTTENTQTTSKSQTTLTVSGSVAPASIDANGRTTYYTDVTKAIQSVSQDTEAETQITVFGNATISTDVELNENITLVVTPGTQLNADVTSSERGMVVVTKKDANGNTVYELIATPAKPEQDYVASITAKSQTAYFQTLADAVKTVQDGQTITLLKDSTTAETITVSRALTFTLDPKTFTMKDTITAGSGFVLTQSGNTYTVSIYIPPVTPPQPDDRPSGGSSDHERTYAIVTEDDGNGSVTVSADEASAGTRITVTVKPDAGYELDELTVTDAKDKELTVTKRSETTYTFHMADSKVTVEASFSKDGTVQKPDTRFDDVAKSAWYYKAVEYVAENGIMSGVSAREFAPNAGFSRAMLAQTLYAMSGKPAVKAEGTFADVVANAWYADAVNWAAEKGYVSGLGDGKFAPDASVTREQMALILYRYAGSPDASGMAQKEFADSSSVNAYAADAIRWTVHEGLISGMENNTLAPQGTATRAQVATILMRFVESLTK